MKPLPLSTVCALVALSFPAPAAGPALAASPGVAAPVLPTPQRTTERRMAGRAGQRGVRSIDTTEPKKTKQDIADEKKLQQDMHICDGC